MPSSAAASSGSASRSICGNAASAPPDFINIRVEELTGDRPFDRLDDYITQDQLRALSDQYKQIAGYSLDQFGEAPG